MGRIRDTSDGIRIIGAGRTGRARKNGNQKDEDNAQGRRLKYGDAHHLKFLLTTCPSIEYPMNTANTRPEPNEPADSLRLRSN
jgi:hypothetical protein